MKYFWCHEFSNMGDFFLVHQVCDHASLLFMLMNDLGISAGLNQFAISSEIKSRQTKIQTPVTKVNKKLMDSSLFSL